MHDRDVRRHDRPLVVLDDDPTGTQLCADVDVLLGWDHAAVTEVMGLEASRPVHVSTNSRGVGAKEARRRVAGATGSVVAVEPDARLLLRGDSTLRGHVLPEYLGLCQGLEVDSLDSMLLVPALPSAGRVTIGGIQWVQGDGNLVPVGETDYARDRSFGFRASDVLGWLEERSGGLWGAADGVEVPLSRLRSEGPHAVLRGLEKAGARNGGCVPDAVTMGDLEIIFEGMKLAEDRGLAFATRCGPAFAAVAGDAVAKGLVAFPRPRTGVLVVVGSYVPVSTRQLDGLKEHYPDAIVEPSIAALLDDSMRRSESERVIHELSRRLKADGLAVLATPRIPDGGGVSVGDSAKVAERVADLVAPLDPRPDVIVAKGGVTAAVTVSRGVGATTAHVVGPVESGIGLWNARWSGSGETVDVLVFPGNVGSDETLTQVVSGTLGVWP